MGKYIKPIEGFVKETLFLDLGDKIKVAVLVSERSLGFAELSGKRYNEMFNVKEPYDPFTHHFLLPKDELVKLGGFYMTVTPSKISKSFSSLLDCMTVWIEFNKEKLSDYNDSVARMDRKFKLIKTEEKNIADGAHYKIMYHETANGKPVVVFAMTFDPTKVKMIAGTPNGTTDYRNQKQTVMGEAEYEKTHGNDVLAAFNADFFDMFGDCSPSGLCVRNGEIIANPKSERYFFGIKKTEKLLLIRLAENSNFLKR